MPGLFVTARAFINYMASRGRSNFSAKVKKYRRPNEDDFDGPYGGVSDNGHQGDLSGHLNSVNFEDGDDEEALATGKRFAEIEERNTRDEQFGFIHYASGPPRTGWMLNMKSVSPFQ